MEHGERLQAFMFRVTTANGAVRTLVEEGSLREPPGEVAAVTVGALDYFGVDDRRAARRMGRVYEVLYCLENSVRELTETTLRDAMVVG